MGFLEKLKPLPRWKNADPAIRLEAVRELDEPLALASLAESDPEAKVRRAAVSRVDDVDVLSRIAGHETDEETRDRAADKLMAYAMDAATAESIALMAVRGLTDTRRLASVAKGAPPAARTEALARVTDEHALASIARNAKDEGTARAALDRLAQHDDILSVALSGDHRDVALAAFEKLVGTGAPDVALLTMIETRTQQKPVAKRARAILQEIEAAEAARRAAEEARQRDRQLRCEAVERLASETDCTRAEQDLSRFAEEWHALGESGELAARFTRACDAAGSAIASRRRDAEEAAERARVRAEALATRDALCARVETLDGDDALEQLGAIEEEWRSLLPLVGNGPEADRLAERFAEAAAACRKRRELGTMLAKTRATLQAQVLDAEALPSLTDGTAALARWQTLAREARGLTAVLSAAGRPAADLEAQLDAVQAIFQAREQHAIEAAAKAQQDVIQRLQRLAERAQRTADADTITLREGERLLKDMRQIIDDVSRSSEAREAGALVGRLRTLQEQIAPRVRELREMEEWRRFANAQAQEQLIIQAETLLATLAKDDLEGRESDLAAAARTLRALHTKWRDAAEAPRDQAQRLWDRFRTSTDLIRGRCETYFKKLREEHVANQQKKLAIVEEAEALAASTEWTRAAARFEQLQNDWRASGPASRDEGRDLAQRFRTAGNKFFLRRREEVTARKKMWAENFAKKEALCVRAETLAESTEWDTASSELKRLQNEWKTIGPVRRAQSETIWARFRAAADTFFERYHNRHQIALATKLVEREALVVDVENLIAAETLPDGLVDRVQQIRTTWNRSVPIPMSEMKTLADRWQAALVAVVNKWPEAFAGSDLDPAAVEQRMKKLLSRVEALLANQVDTAKPGVSPTEMLAAKLRSAFASNAMGGALTDESKWKAAADVVKETQASWQRLPPVTGETGRKLDARFHDVCRRVLDQARRHTSAKRTGQPTAAAV
jgi:hypothetical protein